MLNAIVKTIAFLAILFVMLYVGMNNTHEIDFRFPIAGWTDKKPVLIMSTRASAASRLRRLPCTSIRLIGIRPASRLAVKLPSQAPIMLTER